MALIFQRTNERREKQKHSNQSIWRIIESSENRQFEKQKWKPSSIECNDSDNARNAIRMPYHAMPWNIIFNKLQMRSD